MKGIGEKVLGLFIVQEEDEAKTEHADTPPPPPPAPRARAVASPAPSPKLPLATAAPNEDKDRLTKVIALVESLPAEAPVDVKRQIVAASLEAFGVRIDRVVAAGDATCVALDAQVDEDRKKTEDILADAETRITKLRSEIAEIERLMQVQTSAHADLTERARREKARVRAALDFFRSPVSGTGVRRAAR